MKTFLMQPRFSPLTGKPVDPVACHIATLCDYSGLPVCGDDHLVEYQINDVSGSEEFWYEDDFRIDGKRIDIRHLNTTQNSFTFHPHIPSKNTAIQYSAEILLMIECHSERIAACREAQKNFKANAAPLGDRDPSKKNEILDLADKLRDKELHAVLKELGLPRLPELAACETIAEAMHAARYRVIRKLLAAGKSMPELGLKYEGEDD